MENIQCYIEYGVHCAHSNVKPQGQSRVNERYYRSGTVNSKSFVSKILLRIKCKFELTVHFKHGMLGK